MSHINIEKILQDLSVPKTIRGYQYLETAINLVMNNTNILDDGINKLYSLVASEYQTTAPRVAHAISYAVKIMWEKGDVDSLNFYFSYTIKPSLGRSTNLETIAMIADHLCVKAEDSLKKEVTAIIHWFGVPAGIKGHNYLRSAIMIGVKQSHLLNDNMHTIYEEVARLYKTNVDNVKKAMRQAVSMSWDRGDEDYLSYYFDASLGKPTTSMFISVTSHYVRVKLESARSNA